MIQSPLRYPGGKSRVRHFLAGVCEGGFEEYREAFVGGGSVFVELKQRYLDKKYWINDIYEPLYCFWREMRDSPQDLINAVWDLKKTYLDGRALFAFLKGNIQNMSPKERATAFFVLNRITFSGTTLSGGYSQKTFEGRFTESSIERLSPLASLMFSTKITNIDYEEVLLSSGKDVIIYLDPPYYSATKSALYGKNGNTHKTFEHERFAQICKQCPHKWFITYDNCEYIRKLFSFANITEFEIMYGMRNTGQKQAGQKETELLISNFNLNLQDNLFTIPQALKVEGGE